MNTDHLALPEAHPTRLEPSRAGRRFGYLVAIVINAALFYAANNLLGWDVLPFLLDSFEEALPIINVSLTAAMVVNGAYLLYDSQWFKSLTQIGLAGISMAATVRLLQVFPFDFSAYDFAWEAIARAVLIIAIVGTGIAIVVETVRLVRNLVKL